MPVLKLTDRNVRTLPPGEWWDAILPGFGVRVSPKLKRVYFVRYRLRGRQLRASLGDLRVTTLGDAREAARGYLIHPAPGVIRRTFGAIAEQFIAATPVHRAATGALKTDLIPAWRDRQMESLSRGDAAAVLDAIIARGSPAMAYETRGMILRLFRWAVDRELILVNPIPSLPRLPGPKSRERVLSDSEIVAFWHAVEKRGLLFAAILRLELLLGQRTGEIREMREQEIDPDGWWTIPPERHKRRRSHRVWLGFELARSILATVEPVRQGSSLIFPSPLTQQPLHKGSVVFAMARVSEELGGSRVTAHDLRRTCASRMAGLGVARHVVRRVLGHEDSSVTAIYDRYSYDAEARSAWEAWAAELARLLSMHAATSS